MTSAREPIHPTVLTAIAASVTDALREHLSDVTFDDVEPLVADFLRSVQLAVVLRKVAAQMKSSAS